MRRNGRIAHRRSVLAIVAAGLVCAATLIGCPAENGANGQTNDGQSLQEQVMMIIDDLIAQGELLGAQGPAGPQGPEGPQGPQGDMGDRGPAGASPFTLMGDDAVFTQGKVGIGTTAPGRRLHVIGDARVSGTVFAGAFSSNSPLRLQTGGVTRIHVDDATGNVGIGTTSPESQLHVQADRAILTLESTNSNSGSTIVLRGDLSTLGRIEFQDATKATLGEIGFSPGFNAIAVTAGSNALSVFSNGRFGFGRLPLANELELQGNASKSTAGSWLANSDARIKQDVRTIRGALETLERVRLVRFRYTDEYRAAHPTVEDRDYVNVIAQEFREVFPQYVQASGERLADGSEILQVDPYPLTVYAAAAAQELHERARARGAEIVALRDKIRVRDAEVAALGRRVHEQRSRIRSLEAGLAALGEKIARLR